MATKGSVLTQRRKGAEVAEKVRLGDVCKLVRGVSYKPQDAVGEARAGYVPLLRANNIGINGLNHDDLVYVKCECVHEDQFVCKGDLLVCASSGSKHLVGKAAQISFDGKETFGAFCKVIRPNARKCDFNYLANYFQSDVYRRTISDKATGANINNIRSEHLEELQIPLPSLPVQKRIAAVLDKICELKKNAEAQIENLDLLVKSRFVEMFGDGEVLGVRSQGLGSCGDKWPMVKIEEVGFITSGGTPSRARPEYYNGKIRWYSAGELNSLYLPDSVEHITEKALQESSAKLFKKGSLLIGMYDTSAFKMGILTEDASSNQACANLTPYEDYNVVWLYYLFEKMKPIFLKERQGARQKNLSLSKIKNFEIPIVPLSLQREFAAFVEKVEKLKDVAKKSVEEMDTLYRAKLQEYFG